jgi:hypothetical protein
MSCSDKEPGPGQEQEDGTFQRVRKHVKDFVEASPEEHKK